MHRVLAMYAIRPATIDDIPELVRHRELLFTAMGRGVGGPAEWRDEHHATALTWTARWQVSESDRP